MRYRKRISFIIFPAIAIAILISIFVLLRTKMPPIHTYRVYDLQKGWTVEFNGKRIMTTDLSDVTLENVKKGDSLKISQKFYDYDDAPGNSLVFRSVNAYVNVNIAGRSVYTSGFDRFTEGKVVPKKIHDVPFSDPSSGKVVTISFIAGSDNAFTGIEHIYMGRYINVWNYLIRKRFSPLIVGTFLYIFSMMLFILFPLIYARKKSMSLLFIAMASFCFGLYTLCFNDVPELISIWPTVFMYIEYMTLFCMPLAVMGFIVSDNEDKTGWVGRLLVAVDLIFPIVALVSDLTEIALINTFVFPMYALTAINFPYGIYLIIKNDRMRRKRDKYILSLSNENKINFVVIGIVGLLIFAGGDMLTFFMSKTGMRTGGDVSLTNFSPLGFVVYVGCLTMHYFTHSMDHVVERDEKEMLEGLAYTDALTGLSNRARAEQLMSSDYLASKNFSLVAIDLDHLKETNDTLGHAEGDSLLTTFAKALSLAFSKATLIARMGGDEFTVIVAGKENKGIESSISNLKGLCADYEKDKPYKISFSYGIATSHESESNDPHGVYAIADRRMYDMKAEHHKNGEKNGE